MTRMEPIRPHAETHCVADIATIARYLNEQI